MRQNRPAEARAWCAELAARSRDHDRQIYKLGMIMSSWLAERSGDLVDARTLLERLGAERGFEQDFDRLLALVHVYDQLETPDAIEAAARICRHLLGELENRGLEKLSMLGRLAALERRAGRADVAAELDARFVDAIRRRMHRASLHDLVQVAAHEYLPIERLRAVQPADDRLPPDLSRRERALAGAVRGEVAQSRALLSEAGDWLDRCYLAELTAISGDDDRATELFLSTLQDRPYNLEVTGWLLDRHERSPSAAIARHWSKPHRLQRTLELLETNCTRTPQRPERWRWLATLHRLANRLDDAQRCSVRADALARQEPIGRVLAAGVYHLGGKPKGLVHELWVHRTRAEPGRGGTLAADDIHGNITQELRAAIRNTFVAVREYARSKFPDLTADLDDYVYAYKLPKEDEPSGGLSAGLPSALAFLSAFLQRPIARTIASSGALICEAHDVITIGRIGEAEHKVKAAYHGNLRSLILPIANRVDLEQSTLVPLAITNDVVRYAADLDQAVRLAFGADVFTRP